MLSSNFDQMVTNSDLPCVREREVDKGGQNLPLPRSCSLYVPIPVSLCPQIPHFSLLVHL